MARTFPGAAGGSLDAINVVMQLQWFVARHANSVRGDGRYRSAMRTLATDLAACVSFFEKYRDGWGHSSESQPDYCDFAAGPSTRAHYRNRHYSNSPNRYSIKEVIDASARTLRQVRSVLREWGFE